MANFLNIFYKNLGIAIAKNFSLNETEVLSIINNLNTSQPFQHFQPFGRFTTKEKLNKGIKKAIENNKYCNVSTGIMHLMTQQMRSEYDFYSSGVCGIHNSNELLEALKWYPGELINRLESNFVNDMKQKFPKYSSPPTVVKHVAISTDIPKIILNKHPKSKVLFIKDGMYAYDVDSKEIYGTVHATSGEISQLEDVHIVDLEKRKLNYRLNEVDEGPQDGIIQYAEDGIIQHVKDAINSIKK